MAKRNGTRKSGWKQWSADEARAALKAWKDSGLTKAAFAAQAGMTTQRLSWWEDRLGEWAPLDSPPEATELKLIPVVAAEPVTEEVMAAVHENAAATMRLPGGVALELDVAQVPAAWVAAVALQVARAR